MLYTSPCYMPILHVHVYAACPNCCISMLHACHVLSYQSCPGSTVRAVLSWQSCSTSPFSAFLSRSAFPSVLSCYGCPILPVLAFLSCVVCMSTLNIYTNTHTYSHERAKLGER
jgi:hypothetical protein